MAAEVLSQAGIAVDLYDAMPSVGRKFLLAGVGGIGLIVVFLQTAVDSWDPAFGSGSELFGIGLVFVIGIGILVAGAVVMLVVHRRSPDFFHGRTLTRDSSSLVLDD